VLYVNPEYTTRFEGWTRRESLGLLRYLFDHAGQAEFVTRFTWRPGSIVFWDNRQVWHMAVNDYHGMRRVMNRILLQGSPPERKVSTRKSSGRMLISILSSISGITKTDAKDVWRRAA